MFQGGVAEEAMRFYISLFEDGRIVDVVRYGPSEIGAEGTVKTALFHVGGQNVMCIDSPVKHAFAFTPSFSLFVECESEAELKRLFTALSKNGQIFMALDDHGFSQLFAWVADRYGVSWQLNLA
jgi:predicted 3-demethylubiquinone-9 3-methyltransferase (glyoxalase superfamily)